MNYYNDHDKNACAWLRELIAEGLLPPGEVDDRSILDLDARDLKNYTQCHFFAGIGGWPLALALAGWPTDRPVWTGSCPCQPLSCAGQGKGHADERHLWPAFYALIAECSPPVLFGEQVASKLGREWFAGVRADLEGAGYACGAANLPAASVGAPHKRERLFWVADAGHQRHGSQRDGQTGRPKSQRGGPGMADSERTGPQGQPGNGDHRHQPGRERAPAPRPAPQGRRGFWDSAVAVQCLDGKARRIEPGIPPLAHGIPGRVALLRGVGNAIVPQVAAEFVKAFAAA